MDWSEQRLRRRTFMRMMGIGVAAPFAAQIASWVHADPGDRPVRLVIFYVPHGWPIEAVDPGGEGDGFFTGEVLSALWAVQDQVTVVRGVGMNDGATNHAAIRTVLTGRAEGGDGDSIDRRIAEALGVQAHVLGTVPYASFAGFGVDSFLAKHGGAWVRPVENPLDAADALLGSLGSGADSDAGPTDADFRRRALALTERELEVMHDSISGLSSEQSKLSIHLEAVRALKAGGGDGPNLVTCDERPVLPAVDAMQGLDALDPANFGRVLDGHLEVIAASLTCGTAQVVTLQNMYVNGQVPFNFAGGPGIAKGHHDPISHSWDAAGRTEFATCQRWFFERLMQKVITPLSTTPDPSDSDPNKMVLDNTLIYVCSEISDGANHNSDASQVWVDGVGYDNYLPQVLIGGGAGRIRSGVVINAQGRTNLEMLATIAEAMGAGGLSIGGEAPDVIGEVLA